MSVTYTQDTRRMGIDTPLGPDVLLLDGFRGDEEMSRLFTYELDLRSTDDSINPQDIVGKNVTFRCNYADDSPRYFNGFVRRFSFVGSGDRLSIYRATVVPWLWFLTRTSDCRIFQDKTVPEIIQEVFDDLGFSDYDLSGVSGSHPEWEYCVQYRETAFNFVSRLMEQEGIFYYFRHENGKHTLVMADQKGGYSDAEDGQVQLASNLARPEETDQIRRWEHRYEFRTGKWTHTDYNFEQPSTNLMAQTQTVVSLDGNSKYEFYDFPGEYLEKSDGEADVKVRMEEEETPHNVVYGESICRSFSPGHKFKLTKHHAKAEEGKGYVITSVQHVGDMGGTYITGGGAHDVYSNSFTCIPDTVTFRPQRVTPKPVVQGVQTAVVVGPKGEEIYTDKYGRVKVQFHWDREGKRDERSSCWIRVSQTVAGKRWGAMIIPRIGQEVVVTYLEGDPDRPLITGVVYNAEQMPAYDLPAEKTKSYLKTNSSLGGSGFNEIRFEDKKDAEQIFVHAQKNMDVRVRNDSKERIYGNRHQIIGWEKDGQKGGDQREMIWQDQHLNVKRHQVEHVEGNVQLLVGHGEADDGGCVDVVIEKDRKELIEGDQHLHVEGDRKEKTDGTHSVQSADHHQKVSGTFALEAQTIHLKAGMSVVIEAGTQVSLKVGGNFVDISSAGVAVNGTTVLINSGGAAGSGPGASPEDPEDAEEAKPTTPSQADDAKSGQKSAP